MKTEEATDDLDKKIKAFSEKTKGKSAEQILAEMRGFYVPPYFITLEDIRLRAPGWCSVVQDNTGYKGHRRLFVTLGISNQALANEDFDWKGFIIEKLFSALYRVADKRGTYDIDILTSDYVMFAEPGEDNTTFYFHISYL